MSDDTEFGVEEIVAHGERYSNISGILNRAQKCALDKVPHLKSSPDGRGEEAARRVMQGSPYRREEELGGYLPL